MECLNDFIAQFTGCLPSLPHITLPNISLPNIALPNVNFSDVELPNIDLGGIKLPNISMGEISLLNGDWSLLRGEDLFNGDWEIFSGNENGNSWLFSGTQGDNNIGTSGDHKLFSPDEVNPDLSNMVGGTGNSTDVSDVLSNSGDPGLVSGDGNTAPVFANTGDPGLVSGDGNTAPVAANAGDGNSVPVLSNTGEQSKPFLSNTGESNPEIGTFTPENNGDWIQNASQLIKNPNTNLTNSTDIPIHGEAALGTTG